MNQETSLAILKSGKNTFLTGSAGTGKTWLLNKYISYLRANDIRVAVTASTGIAATHMNGQTIHSWSGMGVRDSIDNATLKKIYKYRHLRKNIDKTKVLILDEVSMLHHYQLTILDQILRFFKGVEAPFGGIQVVLSGDFFQLPPVTKNNNTPSRERFAFMSEAWLTLKPVICYLDYQYRQTDNNLSLILNAIRTNAVDQQVLDHLEAVITQVKNEDILQLYTHNMDVDNINSQRLGRLDQPEHTFRAVTHGGKRTVEMLTKSVLAPDVLQLKQDAKVLFIKNNPDAGYMNGTMGKVVGFSKKSGNPRVAIEKGETITVGQETWNLEDEEGSTVASYKQIPLRLAWAITIHKSQGMTLDQAHIDLSFAFERGQGYVALSRLRSFDGLSLQGFNDRALEIDSLALKADRRFQELSTEAEEEYSSTELEQDNKKFIERSHSSDW